MRCVVCGADVARYRCRYCREAYCSSNCFKRHRNSMTSGNENNELSSFKSATYLCKSLDAATENMTVNTDFLHEEYVKNNNRCNIADREANDKVQTVQSLKTEFADKVDKTNKSMDIKCKNDVDDDNVLVLESYHLQELANNKYIRDALKTGELQQMLITIDISKSRLDALDAALFNSYEFYSFCNKILLTVRDADDKYKKSNIYRSGQSLKEDVNYYLSKKRNHVRLK